MTVEFIICEECGKTEKKFWRIKHDNKPRFCSRLCSNKNISRSNIKFYLTEERKEALKTHFTNGFNAMKISKTDPLFTDIPARKIREWTVELKIRPCYIYKEWSHDEKELLEKLIDYYSPRKMVEMFKRRGYNRSEAAIIKFLSKQNMPTRPDFYNITEIADIMRCHRDKVKKWINLDYLETRTEKNRHYVSPKNLAEFIRKMPTLVDSCRPHIPFLIALLDEHRATREETENALKEAIGA